MTQRGQAAAVIRQVTRVLEEERRGAHFQHRSGEFSLLTPDERNTRRMWGELSSCVGPTFGSLLLTVARAKVHYRMGSYKHLEDLDDVAVKHYKIAHDLLQGVVDAQGLDDEGKATQAEAKRVIGHVHCEWAMALQDMKQYAAAVEHYKAGHAVDKKTHGWVGKVVDVNNPGKYGIPECESLQAAQPGADVAVVGERSREQKDAEGRKRAIDLEAGGGGGASTRTAVRGGETPRKRSRTHEGQLEERVVTARSVTDADIDRRSKAIMQPVFDEWMNGNLSEAELPRRKEAARAQALAEHGPRFKLDAAFAKYTAAAKARAEAEEQEAAAEAALYEALAPLERSGSSSGGAASSSGVIRR